MVETAVIGEIRRLIAAPEVRARALAALQAHRPDLDDKAVIAALGDFDRLWTSLFPTEQARIVQLLVARVTVGEGGLAVDLRHDGVSSLIREVVAMPVRERAA